MIPVDEPPLLKLAKLSVRNLKALIVSLIDHSMSFPEKSSSTSNPI